MSESGPLIGTATAAPKPLWACAEELLACVIVAAGLTMPVVLFVAGSAPWLVAVAVAFVWWRGPGWRALGLGRPVSLRRTVAISLGVGIGFQFVGTFGLEPLIARFTSGQLPDVSIFRSVRGNEGQLAYWVAISWSLAAVVEEVAYRGWILNRLAEVGRYSTVAWGIAVLLSSALFGAVHVYQGVSGVITTGVSGLVFASVYLWAGRDLWAAIGVHGVMDTTGFVLMYLGAYPGLPS
jgi:uncharacterized protein